jgi:tetratricopeptide (TPR) repeat protein
VIEEVKGDLEQSRRPKGANAGTPSVPPETLNQVQALYDQGLHIQAHRLATDFAPLKCWAGSKARILAGRLAGNLGAYRLACVLHWRAWRSDPTDADLVAYHACSIHRRRGPLAALEFLERTAGTVATNGNVDGELHLLTCRAMVASDFRDFSTSEQFLAEAAALLPNHPWLAVVRSRVMEAQDRYPEALECARASLQHRACYIPGIHAVSHTLQLLDRDEEAFAFLSQASRSVENMHVVRDLYLLQMKLDRHDEANASLKWFVSLAPLAEKAETQWIQSQNLTLHCLRDDRQAALAFAEQMDQAANRELVQRLKADVHYRRKRLKVPFVRQHHMTCAPATLSAISRYWKQPAGHLEVAEAICYDGTPSHSERNWAETNGWFVREFRLTWDAAVSLLDRGIPFTLTTSGTTSGHLQAVVGYDECRQTLSIRDPYVYHTSEFAIAPLLEGQRATGPRGMALVPAENRSLLDDLDLPEAKLYDHLHCVERALARHQRAEAIATSLRLQAEAPNHRLALTALRAIAAYDGNRPALLQCVEALLKQFPTDDHLNLVRLNCLRDLARRSDRLGALERLCLRPGADPIFWQQYAQELASDGRMHGTAREWIRWGLRYRPTSPDFIQTWANLLWDERDFARASRYYRLAACIAEKSEGYSRSYFISTRQVRQTDTAIDFLRERNERLGARSGNPACTLVESLNLLRRTAEAFHALDQSLARRPADGDLRLFAADFYGRFSRFEKAELLLREAQPNASAVAWNRTAATVAGYHNRKKDALAHWKTVLELEPLAHDAIRATTFLLEETEGRQNALEFLDNLCQRFPFSCPLLALRIERVGEDGPEAVIPHIRTLIDVNPADAWAWRELALTLGAQGKWAQANQAAQEGLRLEPHNSRSYSTIGELHLLQNQREEAHIHFGRAVRLEVDNEYAVRQFVDTAANLEARKQALGDIATELRTQVIVHGALSAYQTATRGVLRAEDVQGLLQEALRARPDLWQAWSVLIHQHLDTGDYNEGHKLALQACERFPLLPKIWMDLARAEQARLNAPAEIAALERALELNPAFAGASQELAAAYERQFELAKARQVLEAAIAANPLDPFNHGWLAHVLWKQGDRAGAISRVQHALQFHPGYDWAWTALRKWGTETGSPELATGLARELTRLRGGEARSWLLLANCLSPDTQEEELFAALRQALTLNPRCEEAFDQGARALARLGRFDEALAYCAPSNIHPLPPRLLLRAAQVESRRGNLSGAIKRAEQALQEYPGYYGGWQLLAEWQAQNQDLDLASQAAQKMCDLAPLQPVPLGYLGDLKLRLNDRRGARAAFERAFALDPDYTYAGHELFALLLESREFDAAEKTLAKLKAGPADQALLAAVKLAAERGELKQALADFENLCAMEKASAWCIGNAAEALRSKIPRPQLDQIVRRQIETGHCGDGIAQVWIERETSRGRWNLHARLTVLVEQGAPGRRAVVDYLGRLGDALKKARQNHNFLTNLTLRFHFKRVLKKHRSWLAADTEAWGKVGFVLTSVGSTQKAIDWLSDWKRMPQAESWMLYNLILMLHRKGRYDDCLEIIRHAKTLRHEGDLYETFVLWSAFEEAVHGNWSPAEASLSCLSNDRIKDDDRPLWTMSRLLVDNSRKTRAERIEASPAVRASLAKSFQRNLPYQHPKYTRDAYWRFIKIISLDRAALRLWGWWFYRKHSWFGVALVILFLPLVIAFPPSAILFAVLGIRVLRRR